MEQSACCWDPDQYIQQCRKVGGHEKNWSLLTADCGADGMSTVGKNLPSATFEDAFILQTSNSTSIHLTPGKLWGT